MLACRSAHVLWDMQEVSSTLQDAVSFCIMSHIWSETCPWRGQFQNHPFVWIKHIFKKITLHLKVRIWPQIKNLYSLLCCEEPDIYTSTVGGEGLKTEKKIQHENNGVDVLPRVCIPLKNSLLLSVVEIHQ